MYNLPIEFKIIPITLNTLFKYYNKDKIRNYCKSCPNYNKIWSCPEYDFKEEDYLKKFNYAYVISAKLFLKDIEDEIKNEHLENENNTKILTYAYNSIRNIVDKKSFLVEEKFKNTSILLGGRCLICKTCQRKYNKPCLHPHKLRYSLESLGFEVSYITKEILNEDLLFSKGKLPLYCLSVSAILSKEKLQVEELRKVFL